MPSYHAACKSCFVAGLRSLKMMSTKVCMHFLATSRLPSMVSFGLSLMGALYFSDTSGSSLASSAFVLSADLI